MSHAAGVGLVGQQTVNPTANFLPSEFKREAIRACPLLGLGVLALDGGHGVDPRGRLKLHKFEESASQSVGVAANTNSP